MPDPVFQTLFDETGPMTWAQTDVVRDRARRRTRRTQVTVMAAAVMAVGVVAVGVAMAQPNQAVGPQPGTYPSATHSTPDSSPPPSPSLTASPATPSSAAPVSTSQPPSNGPAIADELFLRPDDVGSGYLIVEPGEFSSNDWTFEFVSSMLNCPPSDGIPPYITKRYRSLSRGTPTAEDLLTQSVTRYGPGNADRYLDQIRARVDACKPQIGQSITIGAQRFAGQDALLIEVTYGGGATAKHVLVRQGDLLTEFFTKPERNSAATQELGRKAALRLCEGTPVC